jgi:adenine-specific DNA-methyltransferase
MNKIKQTSSPILHRNLEQIEKIFPGCVVEVRGPSGSLVKEVDFDQLRQELSGILLDTPQERYQLSWPGKKAALQKANEPISKTLRPLIEDSVQFDATKNLFIEGDNLEALKLLQESYLEKVKMIYIDPPYNTGGDFIYSDKFSDDLASYNLRTGQATDVGHQLVANTESNGRFHSDWLSMMYSRLKLSRILLADNGVIFISIDDGEVNNLKTLCNEIFGEKNHLGTIVWKKKTNGNNMGYIPPVHDYIICFAKNASDDSLLGFELTEEYINSNYSNPDNDLKGPWTTSDLSANHEGPHFPIVNPLTGKSYLPAEGRYWVFNEKEVLKRISDGRIIFGKSGNSGPVQKKYLNERASTRTKPESWWDKHGMNSDGTAELARLLSPKVFDHPKPTSLIKNLLEVATKDDDLILDFFAGSGTTADAVMKKNDEDGGSRKYICVQIPETLDEKSIAFKKFNFLTISDLSKERIRRAGKEVVSESVDIGFRCLRIDSSTFAEVKNEPDLLTQDGLLSENIKGDRGPIDLLFQVLLSWGVELSLPIQGKLLQGKQCYLVDGNALIACFDSSGGIDDGLVKKIAEFQPLRVVFRDSGFKDDAMKINVEQIFKALSPHTEIKSI